MEDNKKTRRMKKRLIKIFTWFLVLPTILWAVVCIIGLAAPGLKSALDFDLGENRNDAKFPTAITNDLCEKLEDYYDDKAPFRSILIRLYENMGYALEKPYESGLKTSLVALFHTQSTQTDTEETTETTIDFANLFGDETTVAVETEETSGTDTGTLPADNTSVEEETTAESSEEETTVYYPPIVENVADVIGDIDTTSYFPAVVKNNHTLIGRGDWLFMSANANLDYYTGKYDVDEAGLQEFLTSVTTLNEVCKAQGKKLAYLIAPSKAEVYSEYLPTLEIVNEYKRPQKITDYITANSDVNICYPIEALKAIKPYYLSYMKYDSHWSEIGAFIGYQSILQMLDMPVTNLLTLNVMPTLTSGGDLIASGALNAADYMNDRYYTINYKPEINILDAFGSFSDETNVYHITSDCTNKQKIVVIGDSYRNHMVGFIYRDFADVTLVHVNTLGNYSVCDQYIKDADIIVFVFVERNDNFIKTTSNYVAGLLSE